MLIFAYNASDIPVGVQQLGVYLARNVIAGVVYNDLISLITDETSGLIFKLFSSIIMLLSEKVLSVSYSQLVKQSLGCGGDVIQGEYYGIGAVVCTDGKHILRLSRVDYLMCFFDGGRSFSAQHRDSCGAV